MAESNVFLEDVTAPPDQAREAAPAEPSAEYGRSLFASQRLIGGSFVFVHGLNPRGKDHFARHTWTHANENFWPTAQIGQIAPSSRVFLYSYNSKVAHDVSLNEIDQHATDLLVRLAGKRAADSNPRPIVFVAHSLGGLVVKEALVIAKNNDKFKAIREATTALVFFAVPHQGGHGTELATVLRNLVTVVNGQPHNELLKSLERNSLFQKHQTKLFREQLESYRILTVVEDKAMKIPLKWGIKTTKVIVDATSATLGLAESRETVVTVDADHSNVCRFAGDDARFEGIKVELGQLAKLLPSRNEPARDPVYIIRFPRNPNFVGRTDQLDDLRNRLFSGARCPCVALHGLGGVGKTQIAVQFAYQIRDTFPQCSILWISAVSAESVEQAYKDIARRFQITIPRGEETETKKYVHDYLSRDAAGQWLLIIDNADTRGILHGSRSATAPATSVFPYSKHGAILCTTRTLEIATALANDQVIIVNEMTPNYAEKLLTKSLRDKQLPMTDLEATHILLKDLTYLPLAITQAAAYINSRGISIARYLQFLCATETSMVQTLSRDFEDNNRYEESKNPVAATWLVSFQQIQQEEPLAAELLTFLACIEPVGILKSMLPNEQPPESVEFALGKLHAYSFITMQIDAEEFQMHRLVHLAARNWTRNEGNVESIQIRTIERLDELYPYPEFENRDLRNRLFPHVQRLLHDYEVCKDDTWWQLRMKAGRTLYLEGRIQQALELYLEAENWTAATLLESDRSRLISQHELARAYQANGQVDKAVKILEHIVEIEEIVAEDHPSRLASQHALARAYQANGQVDKAVKILEHVVQVQETLIENHPSRLASQHALAGAYHANGQVDKAVKMLEHVVQVQETLIEDHPNRLASQHELARAYHANYQVDKAVKILEHVVQVQETLIENHPSRLASQHSLAGAYHANGQVDKAVKILEHVVQVQETLIENHPSRLVSQYELARAYQTNGQVDKAVEILEHIVEIEEIVAEDHPSRLVSQHALAGAYHANGQVDKAVKMLEHVVKVQETLAENHPSRLASQHSLAVAYQDNGQVDEAVKMLEHVVKIEEVLAEDHPSRLISQQWLLIAYMANDQMEVARTFAETLPESAKAFLPHKTYDSSPPRRESIDK